MACFQVLLSVVLSSQLLATAMGESNVTDDAQTALDNLKAEIDSSMHDISAPIPQTWYIYTNNVQELANQQLAYDVGNFSIVYNNLIKLADNITLGGECVRDLEVFLDIGNYNVDVVSTYKQVYINLLTLGLFEIEQLRKEYRDLQAELSDNCVDNSTECESTRKLVIAEARRLIPAIKRIPYELEAEVHLLGYKARTNWEVVRTNIVKDHNKAVQNATTCLGYNAVLYNRTVGEQPELPGDESILEISSKLLEVAIGALQVTVHNLTITLNEIFAESIREYDVTIINTRNAVFLANQTVNSLFKIAEELNVTANCSSPDFLTILNSSVLRGFAEYSRQKTILENVYTEGIRSINNTFEELSSLALQVAECINDTNPGTCDFLSKKLTDKTATLPLDIYAKGNVTAALLYQPLQAIRESGSKVVLDVLEQLDPPIGAFKSCVRLSLYDYYVQ